MSLRCELCLRDVPQLTRHHLIPRMRHRRGSAQRAFTAEEMSARVAHLCPPCHKQVHVLIDVAELEQRYNTVDTLREHPDLARFLRWIRAKPGDLRVATRRPGERSRRHATRRGRRAP